MRTQRSDAVLVVMLHAGLTGDRCADQVVADDEVGCCAEVSDRQQGGKADGQGDHPGADRHVTDILAACENQDMIACPFSKNLVFGSVGHLVLLKD